MIVQNIGADGMTDMTFSCPTDEVVRARTALEAAHETLRYQEMVVDDEVAKISVVGIGMRSHSGVAARMFDTMARKRINIEMISTSEIKISCVIRKQHADRAVRVLHRAFGLNRKPTR